MPDAYFVFNFNLDSLHRNYSVNLIKLVVIERKCLVCCGVQEGICLILGRCYAVNDTRSDSDPCWKCLPESSLTSWSWGRYCAHILVFIPSSVFCLVNAH